MIEHGSEDEDRYWLPRFGATGFSMDSRLSIASLNTVYGCAPAIILTTVTPDPSGLATPKRKLGVARMLIF
jgi:hypothetical protein